MQHHKFETTAKMYFNPADETEKAGLLLYKDERHQYFMAVQKSEKGRKILLEKIENGGTNVLSVVSIDDEESPVSMKVESEGTHYNFYYALGGNSWKMLSEKVDARFLSTANAGGFTGTTIGMYAVKSETNSEL
jgi:alpha-N-arabinofuranosidase